MVRSKVLIAQFSGLAASGNEALVDPARLIARPLYIPKDDDPPLDVSPWELIANPALHPQREEFEKLLRRRAIFVPGGTEFVLEMGLVPVWFTNDASRSDAIKAIDRRGWRDLFNYLSFKEADDDIFGKAAVQAYANTLPPVRRDSDQAPDRRELKPLEVWKQHKLRLRKVIEYIGLVEQIVGWRLTRGESTNRFNGITGLEGRPEQAEAVWSHFWIEPVLYVPEPPARGIKDIMKIMESPDLVQRFIGATGESAGALYWSLRGVPSKFTTVEAVCVILDAFYRPSSPTRVVTADLVTLDVMLSRVVASDTLPQEAAIPEYLPTLGPVSAPVDLPPPQPLKAPPPNDGTSE